MTYNITVKNKGQTKVEKADGHKDLNVKLALFRAQGWEISDISRVKALV